MATQKARAWTFTGGYPQTLKLSTINPPQDEAADSTHMLVKVHAAALNPVDIQIMNMPSWKIPWGDYGREKTCVCDFSGTVLAGGKSGFQKGDEIFGLTLGTYADCGGSLSEIARFNTATTLAVKKPTGWSHEQAAAMSLVWLTAYTCVEDVARFVDKSENKRVAILGGSSSTGIYSILLAKRRGWNVITTSSGRNKEFVTSTLGADSHVDYTTVSSIRQPIQDFAPDAVIDCVGGTECVGLPSSKRYITIVGDKTGRTSMGGPYTYYNFLSYHAPVQWIRWARGHWGLGESYDVVILKLNKLWLENAAETLKSDQIFIDSTHPFERADEAFERLNTGRARGKVVVKIV